jgi:hypothetical protein
MAPPKYSSLELVFNHLVLPPKLPGSRDAEIEGIERQITIRLLDATNAFRDLSSGKSFEACDHIQKSLQVCQVVNDNGQLNKILLLDAFQRFQNREGVILHVAEQNAGIFIHHTEYVSSTNYVYLLDIRSY